MLILLFFMNVYKIWYIGKFMEKLVQSIYTLIKVVTAVFRSLRPTDTIHKAVQSASFNKCCEILYF